MHDLYAKLYAYISIVPSGKDWPDWAAQPVPNVAQLYDQMSAIEEAPFRAEREQAQTPPFPRGKRGYPGEP